MVLASSKVVHGWLRIITERWFQSVELRVAVGHDDALHVKFVLSFATRFVNGIIIFHFLDQNTRLDSSSSRNTLLTGGLYPTTVILLFFSLLTEDELYSYFHWGFSSSLNVLLLYWLTFHEATLTITFSFCNSSFSAEYIGFTVLPSALNFSSSGVSHHIASAAQLSIKIFSGCKDM